MKKIKKISNPNGLPLSEVIGVLTGNESDKAPSIQAVNNALTNLNNIFPQKEVISNCNLNELVIKGSGLFIAMSKLTNAPFGNNTETDHFYVLQIVYQPNFYAVQIATSLNRTMEKLYMRTLVNRSWKEWKSITFA